MKKELYLPSEELGENKVKDSLDEALVGVVHPKGQSTIVSSSSGSLGPQFYHHEDDGEYAQWLKEYPESEFDILATSHHPCLSDERLSSRSEDYLSLELCEVLTEEEWILGGSTPWVDSVDEGEINAIHVDGTQDDEVILKASKLEEPLHLKTTSTEIIVGQDVKDYPNVSADWYESDDDQTHSSEEETHYFDAPIGVGPWTLEWSHCDPNECWREI